MKDYAVRQVIPWKLYDITDRVDDGSHYFTSDMADTILAALGKAQAVSALRIYGYVVMSNHYHLLVAARGAAELFQFLRVFHSDVARAINRGLSRRGRLWARRASIVRVSDEPEAQVARLRYILANSVKEGAVEHPSAWGGPHVAHYFESELPELAGDFVESFAGTLSAESHTARLRQPGPPQPFPIRISPLPHLAALSQDVYLSDMRHLMQAVAKFPHDREYGLDTHLYDPAAQRPPRQLPQLRTRARNADASTDEYVRKTVPPPRPPIIDGRRIRVFAHTAAARARLTRKREAFLQQYKEVSAEFRAGTLALEDFPRYCFSPPCPPIAEDPPVEALAAVAEPSNAA